MKTQRINLTLPIELMARLKDKVSKRKISQYIAEATRIRLDQEERKNLRELIKEQCLAQQDQDRQLAGEFFQAEQEVIDKIPEKF